MFGRRRVPPPPASRAADKARPAVVTDAAKVRSEVFEFAALGGPLHVRGLQLSERLALRAVMRGSGWSAYVMVPHLLAFTVRFADGKKVATAEEWDAIGARHVAEVTELFGVACRLSGLEIDAPQPESVDG